MKLASFLAEQGLSTAEFAEQIGVSAVSVTRYLAGSRVPRPEILARIYERTDGRVTPNDFLAQPERAA